MAEDAFTDISGRAITLDCHDHCGFCREYVVSSPKVSFWRVMCYTSAVWLVAYAVFFLTQNTAVLTTAILVTLVGMMLHIHLVKVDHESLLVIGSLGIQVSYGYASGRETSSFIEMGKIKDIVINEAVHMHQIIYYLCVLLRDPSDPNAVSGVVPLFQSSKPRLDCLVKVYKSCQEILSKCS
ncbi:phosphatidylinositol N-acetylglucosaminyltransferase subunit H [Eucyclogobius newberryi]|uniref:phosphatidylinositol N-acetylglucosaminyltransferase subunit H n=1 Tax=Eucyclogobius newberryi TaxID=166745 RepID=UPI003B5ACCE8